MTTRSRFLRRRFSPDSRTAGQVFRSRVALPILALGLVFVLAGWTRGVETAPMPGTAAEPATVTHAEIATAPQVVGTAPRNDTGDEFPNDWYFYKEKRPKALKALEGKPAPSLTVTNWIGEPQDLKALASKGKVVVVDFWGTWCRPCMAAVPKNIKLVNEYKDKGLVLIGVHSTKQSQRMSEAAAANKMNYPVAADNTNKSAQAWKVSFWPTYAVIDHKGIVRAAGLTPNRVEDVVKKLIAEIPEKKQG